MMDIKLISLQKHGDGRGALIALEEQRNIPFEVKRIYYILETLNGVRRGFHAHKVTRQLAIVVKGACKFHLDNGKETKQPKISKRMLSYCPYFKLTREGKLMTA